MLKEIKYRLRVSNIECANPSSLQYAIECNAWQVVRFFVTLGIRCTPGYTYPHLLDLENVVRNGWNWSLLLTSGAVLSNDKHALFECSLHCEPLIRGLCHSLVYSHDYFKWVVETPERYARVYPWLQRCIHI